MPDVPNGVPAVSDEHRRRRREACQRAAHAHQRAATVHEEAATFFELHGKIDRAVYHRSAAEVERRQAEDDTDAADAQ